MIPLIIQDQFYTIQNLQRSPIPQTSNWSGTFFCFLQQTDSRKNLALRGKNLKYLSSLFQWCNKDVRTKKLQLTDLLVSPVHHIMKIPLVIRDIESRTDDMEEKTIITRIHEMKEHSLSKLGTIHTYITCA